MTYSYELLIKKESLLDFSRGFSILYAIAIKAINY